MQDLLSLAVRLADAAAVTIRAIRAAGFEVETKGDETPVTIADRQAEALITAGLRDAVPALSLIHI